MASFDSLSLSLRPSAHELLSDPFIKKGFKAEKLFDMLLHEIAEVGTGPSIVSREEMRPGEGKLDLIAAASKCFALSLLVYESCLCACRSRVSLLLNARSP